eukprot:COSAG02_NODE_10440_length_1940_cov_2.735470_2_plen_102_part_00
MSPVASKNKSFQSLFRVWCTARLRFDDNNLPSPMHVSTVNGICISDGNNMSMFKWTMEAYVNESYTIRYVGLFYSDRKCTSLFPMVYCKTKTHIVPSRQVS